MIPVFLGRDCRTKQPFYFDPKALETHLHLIGATGAGKTTAILALLHPLLIDPNPKRCVFVIDPMGGLSNDLLHIIADCKAQHVQDRLLYIEPSHDEVVLPFNPLLYESEANEYFQIERAMDIILRGSEAQDLASQPRLRRWLTNIFLAAARIGIPIALCQYFLLPKSREFTALMRLLSPDLQGDWEQIYSSNHEAVRILESTCNRLAPFFRSSILRRMFGSVRSHFDVKQFIEDRRIVIVNVSRGPDTLSPEIGSTIGSLLLNEIFSTVRAMASTGTPAAETIILLDEFQRFVSSDIQEAIPEVRQLNLRLILSHQSMSQLEKGDIDLRPTVAQCRSRFVFANDFEDADVLAHEFASLTFDPLKVKHQMSTFRQRIAGHRKITTKGGSETDTNTNSWTSQRKTGKSYSHKFSASDGAGSFGTNEGEAQVAGGSGGTSRTENWSESYLPVHEDFEEVSRVTFEAFDECRTLLAQHIRQLGLGQTLVKLVGKPQPHEVQIEPLPIIKNEALREKVEQLKRQNFASSIFVSKAEIDAEVDELLGRLLRGENLCEPRTSLAAHNQSSKRPDSFRTP